MTPKKLAELLLTVPEFEPRALKLLREQRQSNGLIFPIIPKKDRSTMWGEMTKLGHDASAMSEKLLNLKPVALTQADHPDLTGVFL